MARYVGNVLLEPQLGPLPFLTNTFVIDNSSFERVFKLTLVFTRLLLPSGVPESSERGLFNYLILLVICNLDYITFTFESGFDVVEAPREPMIR